MADIKSLQDKRDAELINILQKLYQDISECKDELNRLIAVVEQGEKRVEPKTLSEVTAEFQAKKIEPIKEVITEGIIK
jgi:hypothetical protein